jgi:hypothetical protein
VRRRKLNPGRRDKLDPGESFKLDPGRRLKFSPAVDKHYPGKYSPGIKYSPERLREKERDT